MTIRPGLRPELSPVAPGSRIALVATSGAPSAEQLGQSIELLKSWGLVPVEGEHLREVHHRAAYLAGEDADRAADLTWAWTSEDIDAVLCVRGGYGSVRMLDHLDADAFRAARPKPLFGSSDVTGVHEWLARHVGVASWFAPMLATNALLKDEVALAGFRAALTGEGAERYRREDAGGTFQVVTSTAAEVLVSGVAEGLVVGGNLSLLAMSDAALADRCAPPHSLSVGSAGPWLAALEDVTEEPYRLDGMLIKLQRSGWFSGAAGVALGSWLDCGDQGEIKALMREYLEPLGVPVAWELGFGHGPAAATFPLNVPGRLVCDEKEQTARLELNLS